MRAVRDEDVDRQQVYRRRRHEPSCTNCPNAFRAPYALGCTRGRPRHLPGAPRDVPFPPCGSGFSSHPCHPLPGAGGVRLPPPAHIKAAMAAGSHLFPSRTEKLSPLAPMVLHTRGRVGSRHFYKKAPNTLLCSGRLVKVAATYSPKGVQYHRRKRA